MWKQMEIPFKLCCSIVNFRDTRYCSMGTYVLHGQLVSQLQRGPFCCQILRTIFVFIDNFKTNKISPQKTNRKETKTPQASTPPTPPLPNQKNSASPHKPHSSSKAWNCNKKLKSWYYHSSFFCVCGCPPGQSHQGRSFLGLYISVGQLSGDV